MNEGQPMNDHCLHIEPCLCGEEHPEVSGDDFDADVMCPKCKKITPCCFGTKGAINYWNKNRLDDTKFDYLTWGESAEHYEF